MENLKNIYELLIFISLLFHTIFKNLLSLLHLVIISTNCGALSAIKFGLKDAIMVFNNNPLKFKTKIILRDWENDNAYFGLKELYKF